jgi:hypothetical protein
VIICAASVDHHRKVVLKPLVEITEEPAQEEPNASSQKSISGLTPH